MAKAASIQVDGRKSYSAGQANEPERRGWNEETYHLKNLDRNNHYDWSRHHLNFELTKGGRIIALGSNATPLRERLHERLHELGWKEYKQGAANAPNCIIDLVFSGDRDIMRRMAFGEQDVCFDLSRKNTNVQRMPEIEKWAEDTYNWCCRKYGEENVIGFQVHLDETTPHAQVQVIPVAKTKQRGRLKPGEERKMKDTVSYYGVVGDTPEERREKLRNLHTDYHLQVGHKYGLERGKFFEDLTDDEKKRRKKGHLSKEDLDRENKQQQQLLKEQSTAIEEKNKIMEELDKQVRQTEKKIKSLNTMVRNLEDDRQRLEPLSKEYKELDAKLQQRLAQLDAAKKELADLEKERNDLLTDIVGQQKKKEDAEKELHKIEDQLKGKTERYAKAREQMEGLLDRKADAQHQYDDLIRAINREKPKLHDRVLQEMESQGWKQSVEESQHFRNWLADWADKNVFNPIKIEELLEKFDSSVLGELSQRANEVTAVAAALFIGYVDQATAFAQTHGGGGGSPEGNWGRNPGEDDQAFRARCYLMARMMMTPPGASRKKGQSR